MGSMFPPWLTARLPYYSQQQYETAEAQRKIQEKASRYDAVINLVGYHEFLTVMMLKIQAEISEATKCSDKPKKQTLHVIRWNAMRELLDAAQNDVIDTIKERDRIKEEELEYLRSIQQPKEQGEEVNG